MRSVVPVHLTIDAEFYGTAKRILIEEKTSFLTAAGVLIWFLSVSIITLCVVSFLGYIDAGNLETVSGGILDTNPAVNIFIHACFGMISICTYMLFAWFVAVFAFQPAIEYYYDRKENL